MYSNEKHRENGIFDIILSVVFYIMICFADFEYFSCADFSDRDIEIHFFQAFLPLCAGCVRFV